MVSVFASFFDGVGGERSLTFQELELSFAQFDSTLDMPLPVVNSTARPPQESPIVDLTGIDNLLIPALPLNTSASAPADATVPVNREAGHTSDGLPSVLNGFLTWLHAMDDRKVGGLAGAFHLALQLARCDVPNLPNDSQWRQWERLRASLPLRPTVTHAVADFIKAHRQNDLFSADSRAELGGARGGGQSVHG